MPNHKAALGGRVLLVSAPWALFNRPSLPLGSLKAYVKANIPGFKVQADHLFLAVAQALGYQTYQMISRRVWRAESVFSALLYPERASNAESVFTRTLSKKEVSACNFNMLVDQVKQITDRWLASVDWSTLTLVGFSISFCQVTASLYLISQIKRICPAVPVVVGGSSFSGEKTNGLLKAFSDIDYLVLGEGERPLTELLLFLSTPKKMRSTIPFPDSILVAGKDSQVPRFCQLKRLEELPEPDYDDYFGLLASFPAEHRFFPMLAVEASRGCWWHRSDHSKQFNGCSFCNLNLQWHGYRSKPPRQMIEEVSRLVQRYQVLSLAFADNAFPQNKAAGIFDEIAKLDYHLSIFTEVRANTPPSVLVKMKQAGVDTVQVGIESLSTRLLGKMNKGVRAIDNLCMMKHCEAVGIVCDSNLMLHFPSSDRQDVDETLSMLEFCRWYRPLKTVSFWLGLESPVYRFHRRFHIRSTFNHPSLKKLFPKPIADAMRFIIQGYRGDRTVQRKRWRPVEIKVRQWEADYATLQRQTGGRPGLIFREGGGFIIIEQHFPNQPVTKHRLSGTSARIYRYCQIPRAFEQIAGLSAEHGPQKIHSFLASMVDKQLMVSENNDYLSLACPTVQRP
ncbi:radical SAM domain protein [Desulfosarcina variabilis str. Montpellier]|uniref:RiPP maturation radical SAM C-methyltransferase n=1 Tax=Desulfosarcina variabilis TaxID=2300 RepID=UPI003AFAF269